MASVSRATVAGSVSLPYSPHRCWKALWLGNIYHPRGTLQPDSRQWLGTSVCTTLSAQMLDEKQRPRSAASCSRNRQLDWDLPAGTCSFGPRPHPHCSLSCVETPAEPAGGCWYQKGEFAVKVGTLQECCVQAGCGGGFWWGRLHLIAPDYGIVWLIGTRDDQALGCVFHCFEAQLHGVEAAIGLAPLAIASPIRVVSSPDSRIGCLLLLKSPVLRPEWHAVAYRQTK